MAELEQGTVTANGVHFSLLSTGPADGPLALCLHGFPDTAWTWRFLLPRLAAAGFRAVAPFMRGYAPTSVPEDGGYLVGHLAMDANALHEALGGDGRAVLIGHDWGAVATYPAVGHEPDRWAKAVTLAVPPPPATAAAFLRYEQLKRSFYMFFFQSPFAEVVVTMDDFAFLGRLWEDWSPGYDATEDLEHVRESLGRPEHLAAALGYYRENFGTAARDPAVAEVAAAGGVPAKRPVLYLHGRDDGCFGVESAEASVPMLPAPSAVEIVEGAGHFLHLEKPDEVGARMVEFLT